MSALGSHVMEIKVLPPRLRQRRRFRSRRPDVSSSHARRHRRRRGERVHAELLLAVDGAKLGRRSVLLWELFQHRHAYHHDLN